MALTKATFRMTSGQVYNVMDFGATGNGTTDDTSSIQSAIDNMPDNGGRLFFPAGTYKVSSSLVLPSVGTELSRAVTKPIWFDGETFSNNNGFLGSLSDGPTTISYKGTGALFEMRLGNSSDTFFDGAFSNLTIIGDDTSGTSAIHCDHITRSTFFSNLMIRNFDTNILIDGEAFSSTFQNIRSQRATTACIRTIGKLNHVSFWNCLFDISEADVAVFENVGSGVNFYGCFFENAGTPTNAGYGLKIGGAALGGGFGAVNLHGCYFETNYQDILVQTGTSAVESNTLNLIGCWIYPYSKQSSSASIEVDGGITMIGNTFNDGQSTGVGIVGRVGSSKPNVFASGNKTDEIAQTMPLLFSGRNDFGAVTAINDGLGKDDNLAYYGTGFDTYLGDNAVFSQSDTAGSNIPLTMVQRNRANQLLTVQSRTETGSVIRTLVDESDVTTATRQGFIKVRIEDESGNITDGSYFVPFFSLT
jgi:hypothetical protein